MSTKNPAPVGKTRWRRFGVAAGAGFGVVALILYLTMSGALALNFAFSGIPFTLKADRLEGNGFVQYAVPDKLAQDSTAPLVQKLAGDVVGRGPINNVVRQDGTGTPYVSDAVNQIRDVTTLTGLDQQVCAPTSAIISGLPSIRVHILGTGNTTASNLTIQAPAIAATSAEFRNINIGKSLGNSLNDQNLPNPYDGQYPNPQFLGNFSQDATSVVLTGVKQVGIGTEAGVFTIGGLRVWAEFVPDANCATLP